MLKLFSIICEITSLISFLFGLLILINRWKALKSTPVTIWSFFCFAVSFWSLGLGLMTVSSSEVEANFWIKIHYIGAIFIPSFFLHFSLDFLQLAKKFSRVLFLNYFFCFLFLGLNFMGQLSVAIPKPPFNFYTSPGSYYNIYSAYFSLCVIFSHIHLFRAFKKSEGLQRRQILYLFIGTAIGFGGGSTAFFPVYNIPLFPFGVPLTTVYVFMVGYSILIYRLMDFNLLVRWGIVFGISFIIVFSSFILFFYFIETSVSRKLHIQTGLLSLIITSLSVMFFGFIRKSIINFVDRVIFKTPDMNELIGSLLLDLEKTDSIVNFCETLSMHLKRIWDVNHAGIGVWINQTTKYVFSPSNNFKDLPVNKVGVKIDHNDFLIKTLLTERRLFKEGIIIEEDLTSLGNRSLPGVKTTFWKMRRTMRWLNADLCAPIIFKDDLIGVLVLGKKKKSNLFNEEDRKLIVHISSMIKGKLSRFVYS
ncbi:MAG: histidine kinase N-terminal 7TM domain-containing protein [Elusimicrobiota bacterium]